MIEYVSITDITNNLDNRRVPLNDSERSEKESNPIYPYIGANNIMGYIDEYLFDEKILCVAEDGGSWGALKTCAKIYNEKVWVNNHAHVLTAKNNLVLEYLMHYLNFADLSLYINGATRGKLTQASLNSIKIPLPPLDQQKKIAAILDAADTYRQKTKALIAKYDELAQSLFLEMFGDPVRNEKGWKLQTIGSCLDFLTSGSRGWAKHYAESGSLFIRIQNVGYNELLLDNLTFVEAPQNAEAKRTKVESQDMLLSITADLGRTAVIPNDFPEGYINQHLAILRFNKLHNPTFISAYIASIGGQILFQKLNKGGVKAGLNFNDIKSYQVFCVPKNLQDEFKKRLNTIKLQKALAQKSLEKAEELFNSLLQKSF